MNKIFRACMKLRVSDDLSPLVVSQSDHPRGFDTAKAITYPPMSWWKTNGLYQVIFLCHYFSVVVLPGVFENFSAPKSFVVCKSLCQAFVLDRKKIGNRENLFLLVPN